MAVHGPLTCLSLRDGDVDAGRPGAEASGLFADDRRVVHRLVLTVSGRTPVALVAASVGATTETLGVARHLGDPGPDPTVEVLRRRVLGDGGMQEEVVVRNRSAAPVPCVVDLVAAGDGADLHDVKDGVAQPEPLDVTVREDSLHWADRRHEVTVSGDGARATVDDREGRLSWALEVPPGGERTVTATVVLRRVAASAFDADPGAGGLDLTADVRADDSRLDRTVSTSLADLCHLAMRDPLGPDDVFVGAGTPWYLTLFGRDALWAARLTLPFGTDLARGTLRTLARRQGRTQDASTAEAPGKIPHEVRRDTFGSAGGGMVLPSTYYGTVDATPLWVCLLVDAWRWGMDAGVVRELAPHLHAALGWMERAAAESPDGFLRYVDDTGTGLTNQGWKDSGDSMRDAAGRIATAPIALVETQAYAVEAARGAARLLEEVLEQDGSGWRTWAEDLAARVDERFWSDTGGRRVLAMALDGAGGPVDGLGSNIGHVLGTGTLGPVGEARVAAALESPDLLGPLGISTLARSNPAFNPIGYHTGSVWTHDSAICALGLVRAGRGEAAARVARSLVDVAAASGHRWPELYGADPVLGRPAPYPASCRPQAWAAASAGALVSVLLGIEADVPAGRLRLSPVPGAPFGALSVRGMRLGSGELAVALDAEGQVTSVVAPDGIEVVVG